MAVIKVGIKFRPQLADKADKKLKWTTAGNRIESTNGKHNLLFENVFDAKSSTETLFKVLAQPIVAKSFEGYNGTIFAYGQTASGKTFSMIGDDQSPGIISLSLKDIFQRIASAKERTHQVRIGYIEIYNDKLYDLFDNRRSGLSVFESHGSVVINQKEFKVNSEEDVLRHFNKGNKCKRIIETSNNERSSRSHTIFRITVESKRLDGDDARVSNLFLVDLAGSEKPDSTKSTFSEGLYINKSLLALGKIIREVSKKNVNLKLVNFRECKLTRILSPALGGNSWTAIICTVSPFALEETYQTICFAQNAKKAKTYPVFNQTPLPPVPVKKVHFETPTRSSSSGEKSLRRRRVTSVTSGSESDLRCPVKKLKPNENLTLVQQSIFQAMRCEARSSSQHVEANTQSVVVQQEIIEEKSEEMKVLEIQLKATEKVLFNNQNQSRMLLQTKIDEIFELKMKLGREATKIKLLEDDIKIFEKTTFEKEIEIRAINSRTQKVELEKSELMSNFEQRFKEFQSTLKKKDEIIAMLQSRLVTEQKKAKTRKIIDLKTHFRMDEHYGSKLEEMRAKFEALHNSIQQKFVDDLEEKEINFKKQLSAREDEIMKLTEEVEKQSEIIARSTESSFDSDLGRLKATLSDSLNDFRSLKMYEIQDTFIDRLTVIFAEVHKVIRQIQKQTKKAATPPPNVPPTLSSNLQVVIPIEAPQAMRLTEPSTVQSPTIKGGMCPYCNKTFSRKAAYQRHLRVKHLIHELPFDCDACDEAFKTKSALNSHQITMRHQP